MKRIVNSEEMKFCDSNTISHFGIPSLVLMERAALCVVSHIPAQHLQGRVLIVCGNGNNGADGLAIARLLYQKGCELAVAQIAGSGKRSQENEAQLHILKQYGIPISGRIPDRMDYSCVIDALFGVGLSRAPKDAYAEWIMDMNRINGYKVAVDIPSGVSGNTGMAYEPSFCADLTVTFAYRKVGQILYPGREKCGAVVVSDIGITDESWLGRQPACYAPDREDLAKLPKRPAHAHKGTFGKLLVVAGSKNMAGAALFCAQAAYRTGCGLVKICTPEENRAVMQTALPEAVLLTYKEEAGPVTESIARAVQWATVIALGPGLGTGKAAQELVKLVLQHAAVPMVIDADGLNILSGHLDWLEESRAKIIVTPHLGEMARLTKKELPQIQNDLVGTAREFARRYAVICVLKDAATVTASSDCAYLNVSGCSAMSKGGSGDVLTGIIAGLLAQGMETEDAAYVGAYIHGLAGEAAAEQMGSHSVLARDLINAVSRVLQIGQDGPERHGYGKV